MPVGIRIYGNQMFFRVYSDARLYKILRVYKVRDSLFLLPQDPSLFVESLLHTLENRIEWNGECPLPANTWGYWLLCKNISVVHSEPEIDYYTCSYSSVGGKPLVGYSRIYGCTVELLVYLTKVKAGVYDADMRIVQYLLDCIRRSGGVDAGLLLSRIEKLLQKVLGDLQ
jgi:hypothetical protein